MCTVLNCHQCCLVPEGTPPQGIVVDEIHHSFTETVKPCSEVGHQGDCVASPSPADSLDEVEWQKRYVVLAKDERRLYFFNDTEVREGEGDGKVVGRRHPIRLAQLRYRECGE